MSAATLSTSPDAAPGAPPGAPPSAPADSGDARPGVELGWALGGPALVGFGLGLCVDLSTGLEMAAALPAVFIGVLLLTVPTLYIGAAFLGVAPAAPVVVRALRRGVVDSGRVLLALAPSLALLAATSAADHPERPLCIGAVLFVSAIALHMLQRRLFGSTHPVRARLLFGAWSLLFMATGLYLLLSALP